MTVGVESVMQTDGVLPIEAGVTATGSAMAFIHTSTAFATQ